MSGRAGSRRAPPGEGGGGRRPSWLRHAGEDIEDDHAAAAAGQVMRRVESSTFSARTSEDTKPRTIGGAEAACADPAPPRARPTSRRSAVRLQAAHQDEAQRRRADPASRCKEIAPRPRRDVAAAALRLMTWTRGCHRGRRVRPRRGTWRSSIQADVVALRLLAQRAGCLRACAAAAAEGSRGWVGHRIRPRAEG